MMGTRIYPVGPAYRCCLRMQQIHKRDLPPLSCGKSSRCKLWPWHGGSKVKRFVFPGSPLIIYSWNKEEGMEREKEMESNPPARGLWCGKQNLRFNLPSNEIHMTHPELVHSHASISLFVFVFTCLSLRVLRTHMVFVMFHTCAR